MSDARVQKNEDILTGFAEIAAYLCVSRRTVISWEAHNGLPVMRPIGPGKIVYASKTEIEQWRRRKI